MGLLKKKEKPKNLSFWQEMLYKLLADFLREFLNEYLDDLVDELKDRLDKKAGELDKKGKGKK